MVRADLEMSDGPQGPQGAGRGHCVWKDCILETLYNTLSLGPAGMIERFYAA